MVPHKWITELFWGLKPTLKGYSYTIMYFIRRILLCSLVVVDFGVMKTFKLSVFIIIEGVFLISLILVHPFLSIQDRFVYTMNAGLMLFYIG